MCNISRGLEGNTHQVLTEVNDVGAELLRGQVAGLDVVGPDVATVSETFPPKARIKESSHALWPFPVLRTRVGVVVA